MNPMQKMRMMLARGILNLVSSATGLQIMQIDLLADETRDDVERVQNYGHSGHPPKGSTVAAVALGAAVITWWSWPVSIHNTLRS